VDTLHAQIEKKMKHVDIYSPLGYVANFENINSKKISHKILNIEKKDFYLWENSFQHFNFSGIPFSKVKEIQFTNLNIIKFRTSFNEELNEKSILPLKSSKVVPQIVVPNIPILPL
jgi:hypothetical protein